MKYKILLAGKNQSTIDDFFYVMSSCFECMTTSVRNLDMIAHLKYFQPDAFVYCMSVETKESIMSLVNALEEVGRKQQKLILVGEHEDCKEFLRWRPDMISLILEKPLNANFISQKIIKLLDEAAEAEMERQRLKKQSESHYYCFGDKQILVIDDDHMMLKLIKEKLRNEYSVATAVSGKIGLDFLDRKPVDLILLDYEMPGDSGVDVLEKRESQNKRYSSSLFDGNKR